jgi:GT2 family glycosyltransferase
LDYPAGQVEILVVDGMSGDGTQEIVAALASANPDVRLLENPLQITSSALNIGVRAATGEAIFIIGAHSVYPPHYVRRLVEHLRVSGADVVGGACVTTPGAATSTSRAIAVAMSHPFGVGNSYFRLGSAEARWVDTVPFGCYRRDVFDRFGHFDEELVRNQDDEFNLRILKSRGRLLLVPDVTSTYYARASLRQLTRMFYQYGYYKPLVARKLGRIMTLRQLVPGALVAGLTATALLAPWSRVSTALFVVISGAYVAVNLVASLHSARRRCGPLRLAATFAVMHMSYGFGFLVGALRLASGVPMNRRSPAASPLSR